MAAANPNRLALLHGASSSAYIDAIKLLLDKAVDVAAANNGRWTPLYIAFSNGYINVVKLLLDQDALRGGTHEEHRIVVGNRLSKVTCPGTLVT